jgi:hypothetical protein
MRVQPDVTIGKDGGGTNSGEIVGKDGRSGTGRRNHFATRCVHRLQGLLSGY